LPLLLQRLNAEQRRLLWHRYLREHPLNPRQIEKVMGLSASEQQRLEEEALALLRQAGREHGDCDMSEGGGLLYSQPLTSLAV
jgi:DNA-directed RNA polymerase sigma subunit (sigma70/sigma32)